MRPIAYSAPCVALLLEIAALVRPVLAADFSGEPTSGCPALTVDFIDLSTEPNIVSWSWDFGDGGTSSQQNPSHTYQNPGTYTVSLTVSDGTSEFTETKANYITVFELSVADFTGNPTSGCPPLRVTFSDLSSGSGLTSWSWDFGDGGTSTSRNPSHIYQSAGSFTVKLTVAGECSSNTKTRTGYVNVAIPLVADFQANETSVCVSQQVSFGDRSTGDGLESWSWDFGDGGTSTSRNPNHAYQSAGTFTVKLTVTGDCGSNVETKTGYITVVASPVANFQADKTTGCAPLAVKFTDTSSGDVNSRQWDFGDGTTGTDSSPSHTYSNPGTHTVGLVTTGTCGSDSETKTNFITVSVPVVANFQASPRSGWPPLTVNFTDTSTGDDLSAWSWDFGDGGTSATRNPSHTYQSPGTYTVELITTGACGSDSETKTGFVTVSGPPDADFQATPRTGCAPLEVTFSDRSTGDGVDGWRWDFGDGVTSTSRNLSHTYQSAGSFTIKLTVGGDCGSDTEIKTDYITVSVPADVSFRAEETDTSSCTEAQVKILLSNDCAVEAFSFGLAHDPAVAAALQARPSGITAVLNGGLGPDFWDANLEALVDECQGVGAGVTVAMVGSLRNPAGSVISPGFDQEVAIISYQPAAGVSAGMATLLEFVDCLRPGQDTEFTHTVVTCGSSSKEPRRISGRVRIDRACFKRGDCNCDGVFDISDAVTVLNYLFNSSRLLRLPCCLDACDANDDGGLDISDGIAKLARLFLGAPELPEPFRTCGPDPNRDHIGCERFDSCVE